MNGKIKLIRELNKRSGYYLYQIVDEDGTVWDTRKSTKCYVAASIYFSPDKPENRMRPLYHGRIDLIGRGEANKYKNMGLICKVAYVED